MLVIVGRKVLVFPKIKDFFVQFHELKPFYLLYNGILAPKSKCRVIYG